MCMRMHNICKSFSHVIFPRSRHLATLNFVCVFGLFLFLTVKLHFIFTLSSQTRMKTTIEGRKTLVRKKIKGVFADLLKIDFVRR